MAELPEPDLDPTSDRAVFRQIADAVSARVEAEQRKNAGGTTVPVRVS
ncbi:hypothetical protein [Streptosporangium roseum]